MYVCGGVGTKHGHFCLRKTDMDILPNMDILSIMYILSITDILPKSCWNMMY